MKPLIIKIILAIAVVAGIGLVINNYSLQKKENAHESDTNNASQNVSNSESQGKNAKATRPMMGEASFSLSVCDEVTKETVASIIGKEILETKDDSNSKTTSCTYITNKQTMENVVVVVAYMDPNTQKKFYETGGKEIRVLSEIPMDNFSVWDNKKDQVGGIYLLMAPEKYVRVERSNTKIMDNATEIALAKRVAEIILTGK